MAKALLFFGMLGCGPASPPPVVVVTPEPTPTPTARAAPYRSPSICLAMGDSITAASGSYRNTLWTLAGTDRATLSFIGRESSGLSGLGDKDHEGYPGYTTEDVGDEVLPWLEALETPPTHIIVEVGTNDIYAGMTAANLSTRVTTLLASVRAAAPSARILVTGVWMTVPANQAQLALWLAALPSVVTASGSIYVPVALGAADMLDTLHPNTSGQAKIGTALWAAML